MVIYLKEDIMGYINAILLVVTLSLLMYIVYTQIEIEEGIASIRADIVTIYEILENKVEDPTPEHTPEVAQEAPSVPL